MTCSEGNQTVGQRMAEEYELFGRVARKGFSRAAPFELRFES